MMRRRLLEILDSIQSNESSLLRVWVKRGAPLMPWLSLGWGLVAAALITRNISNPERFVAAGVSFVVLSLVIQALVLPALQKHQNPKVQKISTFVSAIVLQSAAQYVLMFVLPFLYLGGYGFAFGLSVVFAAISLWDPWWMRAIQHPVFTIVLRQWILGLILSLLFVSFFSAGLGWAPLAIALSGLVLIRWDASPFAVTGAPGVSLPSPPSVSSFSLGARLRRWGARVFVVLLPLTALSQKFTRASSPYPLLGVWLRDPGMTMGKPSFLDRESFGPQVHLLEQRFLQEDLSGPVQSTFLEPELCCVTPVIASLSFGARIQHRWSVNGTPFETIDLPEARGNGENASFRTYSCKRRFPVLEPSDVVTCEALVAHGLSLGTVEIVVGAPQD